jgi:hypothetical protein
MTATFAPIYTPITSRPDKAGLDLTGGGRKIVLHTTEGGASSLPFGWYGTSGYVPNYTVSLPLRQWHRHLPDIKGAYTLIDGNRWGDRVIQIEVCGHAATIDTDFTPADLTWFGETLHQLADANGVPWDFAEFVAYPASYGLNARQRLDVPTYTAFAGICGHQHVPRNDHGDLGALQIEIIKAAGTPTLTPTPGEQDMPDTLYRFRASHNVFSLAAGVELTGKMKDHLLALGAVEIVCEPAHRTITSTLARADLKPTDLITAPYPGETMTEPERAEYHLAGVPA